MTIGEFRSKDLTKNVERITDVFSCADGGGGFVLFCNRLKKIEADALAGDADAQEILQVVGKFGRLLKALTRG